MGWHSAFAKPRPMVEWFSMGYGAAFKVTPKFVYGNNLHVYYHAGYRKKNTVIRSGLDFTWQDGVYRNMWNVNVSYGKWKTQGRFLMSFSGGPSFQSGRTFNRTRMITLGISAHGGISWMLAKDVGLGVELYGHYNLFQPAAGVRLVLNGLGQ